MIEFQHVEFRVPTEDGGENVIIRDLSLTLDTGKFIVITGPNGGTPLDTGAHIGEYRMFNTTGFLGALERNCLDR